jgi:hypothetical protein
MRARHLALDDGLNRLRAPLDDPDLLHAGPVPELSVELSAISTAPAPPPSADSYAAEVDDEDDEDEYYVDDLAEVDDDDDDDDSDDAFADDEIYADDDFDDDDGEDDEVDQPDDESAQALPGMAGFAENLRPSEQRRAIRPDVSGPAEDALEPARWEQPQFGINLAPPDAAPSNVPPTGKRPDLFSERLRQAVTEDEGYEDPAFEDKATKFFEPDEPTTRRRFGRRG